MDIEFILSKEGFEERIASLKRAFGEKLVGEVESPKTYPCLLVWEYDQGNCRPDTFWADTIEKADFDDPFNCEAIDTIYT